MQPSPAPPGPRSRRRPEATRSRRFRSDSARSAPGPARTPPGAGQRPEGGAWLWIGSSARENRSGALIFPPMSPETARTYRMQREGYIFALDPANVARLKSLPDFEGKEEPALAEDFLRFRIETWAENLA